MQLLNVRPETGETAHNICTGIDFWVGSQKHSKPRQKLTNGHSTKNFYTANDQQSEETTCRMRGVCPRFVQKRVNIQNIEFFKIQQHTHKKS